LVTVKGKSKIATYVITDGISQAEKWIIWKCLGWLKAKEGDEISFSHVQPVTQWEVLEPMYGQKLNYEALQNIIKRYCKGEIF
jgi:thymidine phosphorylase